MFDTDLYLFKDICIHASHSIINGITLVYVEYYIIDKKLILHIITLT